MLAELDAHGSCFTLSFQAASRLSPRYNSRFTLLTLVERRFRPIFSGTDFARRLRRLIYRLIAALPSI